MITTPLYCPRFIGRERELAALADLARRAAAGESLFAFVSGDAGAGKTRLIDELRRHLPRGMRGVRGTCMEYAPSPMGSVLDIVAALVAERDPHGDAPPIGAPTGDDPVDKRRLFERVASALRTAAAARPFVMILDDAHWADTVTLELLQFLIFTLQDARVFIVLAYRSDELGDTHPLQALIARSARARQVQHIELDLLSNAHIRELIDATLPKGLLLPSDALREVRDRSEGNPLYAEEFLKAAADNERRAMRRPILPASLRGLLVERLRRLPANEARLLEMAALIGRRFDASFLARIGGCDIASLDAFLRLAIDEHFLIEDVEDPGWFSFRHALTRDTILSGMLAMHARALHLRIAQEIEREEDRDARVVELAEHYWRAASFAECSPYAVEAAELAKARHAYSEAADFYERALACGSADEHGFVVLHEKAAAAYASLGSPRKVLEHLDVAAEYYRASGDPARLVEVYLDQALAFRRTAQTERAFAVLGQAARLSRESGNDRLLLKSAAQLAQLHALAEEWGEAETNLRTAEPLLAFAEPRDAVRFYTARATIHLANERLDDWQRNFERATVIARAHGDPTLVVLALTNYGIGARKFGLFPLALTALGEAVEAGRPYGPLYIVTFARLVYLNVLYLTGDLAGARAELLDVLAEIVESVTLRILIAQFGAAISIVLRDDELFQRSLSDGVLEAAFSTNEPMQFAPLAAAIGEYRLAHGDDEDAVTVLERMLERLPADSDDVEVLIPVALCCSEETVKRARARFGKRTKNRFLEACRELFDAYAAARFGTRQAKLRHAKAAASLLQRLGSPLLEAEAHDLAEQPQRAVALCEMVGALRLPRRLGPRPARRASTPQLTAREREVVQHALTWMSNSAIADELSLSERTVEAHLAAAYRKLGVRSRSEMVSVLVRSGQPRP